MKTISKIAFMSLLAFSVNSCSPDAPFPGYLPTSIPNVNKKTTVTPPKLRRDPIMPPPPLPV
jgi:hypothetical protein